jgi:hypothetical protein
MKNNPHPLSKKIKPLDCSAFNQLKMDDKA